MSDRPYELILFGASGFTGSLTAEYLARNAPACTRWALAGRDHAKLEAVRARLLEIDPACEQLPLLPADTTHPESLAALARATRVMISTVGPYLRYGEPLVAACAREGTDYVDLAGEPEFVDRMYLAYDELARRTGARLVHACGFDSIPADIGVLFTVAQLPDFVPISVEGFASTRARFSGGTYHSAINAMGRLRQSAAVARERRSAERAERDRLRAAGRRIRGIRGRPRNEPRAGGWALPAPIIDPQIVLRSARALDRYGPDFSYGHYLVAGDLVRTTGLASAFAFAVALAQLPPTRDLLLKLKRPGDGPSAEQRARSRFRVRFLARTGARTLVTEVSGGDPGYGETAKMLGESALCLAHDELPERAGQLTTAVAMGERLLDRLQRAGIEFKVVTDTTGVR